ncbi:MAG TPA: N-formylglutamate amidohydrolase [Hyphomicrobiales bacterium]|nr:N-formylglutamate amidohydrolase [Hyphomicrobiales bacterium]
MSASQAIPELETPICLQAPDRISAPFLFSSPHSGRIYPRAFLDASRLDANTLRKSEDSFVDELFEGVVPLGVPLLRALFPRAYLDVNREPYELDPRMFEERLPPFANTRSVRVNGGLGTIARIVADTHEIYDQPLPVIDALRRIEQLYKPYHRTLGRQLIALRRMFGIAILIDCHSMPSTATGEEQTTRPDFVLGDRYGTSCTSRITEAAQSVLEDLGYSVRRNKPYAGGYITERYGNPVRGVHALQIEVNRALYMDETTLEKTPGFERTQADLTALADALFALEPARLAPPRQAAE